MPGQVTARVTLLVAPIGRQDPHQQDTQVHAQGERADHDHPIPKHHSLLHPQAGRGRYRASYLQQLGARWMPGDTWGQRSGPWRAARSRSREIVGRFSIWPMAFRGRFPPSLVTPGLRDWFAARKPSEGGAFPAPQLVDSTQGDPLGGDQSRHPHDLLVRGDRPCGRVKGSSRFYALHL